MYRFYKWLVGVLTLVGTLALVGYLTAQAWAYLGPRKPVVSALRQQVAASLLPLIVADLSQNKRDVQSVAFFHLANDASDYVSDQLRAALEQSGVVALIDRPLGEKLEKLLKVPVSSVAELEPAVRAARGRGVKGVLFGRVDKFESVGGAARIDLELTLANVETHEVVFTRHYSKDTGLHPLNAAAVEDTVHQWGGASRFLAWVVIVLLLPVFTISFIRAMVRRESNRSNAFTLGVYTAADTVLAWLVLGAGLSGWLSVGLFLLAVGGALAYHVFIMTFALRMER